MTLLRAIYGSHLVGSLGGATAVIFIGDPPQGTLSSVSVSHCCKVFQI